MNNVYKEQRSWFRRLGFMFAVVGVLALTSCSSVNSFLKAKPTTSTGFLAPRKSMNPHPGETPFHYAGHSKSWEIHERANSKRRLYIAPVDTSRLRRIQRSFARASYKVTGKERPIEEMANQVRLEFAQAFVDSVAPAYVLTDRPGNDSVTLELSLIELDPTSVSGNAARKVAGYFVSPLVTVASYGTTAGSIAIEGKVVCSDTQEVVFQFADREGDRLSLFSVKDFQPYGFIDEIIEEWADQFESFCRTPTYQEIRDSSWFTLNPF
jgi:hypothetical protein